MYQSWTGGSGFPTFPQTPYVIKMLYNFWCIASEISEATKGLLVHLHSSLLNDIPDREALTLLTILSWIYHEGREKDPAWRLFNFLYRSCTDVVKVQCPNQASGVGLRVCYTCSPDFPSISSWGRILAKIFLIGSKFSCTSHFIMHEKQIVNLNNFMLTMEHPWF